MSEQKTGFDFRALCRSTHGLYLVLTPDLVIADASDEYLRATFNWRGEIEGRHMFEVFPDNPQDPLATGTRNLRSSLARVLETGATDVMALQKYDVRDHLSGRGAWIEKHWLPVNRPVFAPGSREMTHVLHQVDDVTEMILLQRWLAEELLANREQRQTLERMTRDLAVRAGRLAAAGRQLTRALAAGGMTEGRLEAMQDRLVAPGSKRYLSAGQRVAIMGIYRAAHPRSCRSPLSRRLIQAGECAPRCSSCGDDVVYRLERRLHA